MKKMSLQKKSVLLATCYLLLATLTGCGYTTRSTIAAKFRTIHIKQFSNKIDITQETDAGSKYRIYRPMLETNVTKEVINVLRRNRLGSTENTNANA